MSELFGKPLGAAIVFLASVSASGATVFYVSPNGNDANSGLSISTPFATLQKGADVASPGDTIYVGDGTYTSSSEPLVDLSHGGAPDAWITFQSLRKWGARLSGANFSTSTGVYIGRGASYVRFQDFQIFGFRGIAFSLRGSNILLRGNLVHDIGRVCTDTDDGVSGVYAQGGANVVVDRNIFHDIGRLGPGENGCRPRNAHYQNHDHGVYIDGTNNLSIANSFFYNIEHGWPVHLYPRPSIGLRIIGNTFLGANKWRDGHIYVHADLSNAIISDNVMYAPRRQAMSYGFGAATNVVIQNNTVFPGVITTDAWPSGVVFTGNRNNANPGTFIPEAWAP